MIKGGGDWIWVLCDLAFERSVVPEDWRSAVLILLYEVRGEGNESRNYRGISLLSP